MSAKDETADYEILLQRCTDRAYSFALRLCGNDSDAQDLVQEAFTRAFEHRDRYDSGRPFDSWIFKILQNIYLDSIKRYEARHGISLDGAPPTVDKGSWADILPGPDP